MRTGIFRRESGSILILALWAVSFLSILSVSIAAGARQKATLLNRFTAHSRLHAIALSGVEQARAVLKGMDPAQLFHTLSDPWADNISAFRNIRVEQGYFSIGYDAGPVSHYDAKRRIVYGLKDESGKINLNTADAPTLVRLIESFQGLDRDTAEEIAYAVVDWRDADSALSHPTLGAETDHYGDLRQPYKAKDAPFEIIDELLLVKGVNRAIFDKIKDSVTVYGPGSVNINTASKEAFLALGIGPTLAERMLTFRKGADGADGTADDGYIAVSSSIASSLTKILGLNDIEAQTLNTLAEGGKLGTASAFFSVKCRASISETGPSLEMEAVIGGDGKIHYVKASEIIWPSS